MYWYGPERRYISGMEYRYTNTSLAWLGGGHQHAVELSKNWFLKYAIFENNTKATIDTLYPDNLYRF